MSQSAEPGRAGARDAAPSRRWRAFTTGFAYFARHWRGELHPLHTFLVNGLIVGVLMLSIAAALGWSLEATVDANAIAFGLTSLWAGIALITLWQVVGVLRAADRHARSGRGPLALGAALVATLLGVVVSLGVFLRAGLPQIVEASQFALGKDPIGEVTLRVSDDGSALELDGPIVFGVAARVAEALKANPGLATVRFSSPGGRVVEARELRDLLRSHGVTTVAAGNCASACVVAFMAGRDRLLAKNGNLGFHRYRSPGLGETEAEASMAIDRRDFVAQGVPAWFIDRAYSTPNSEMWRPTMTELAVANIVTGELAADGSRLPRLDVRARLDAQVAKRPLYAALKSFEPAAYGDLLDTIEAGVRRGDSLQEAGVHARPLITRLAARYVPTASDEAIVQATTVAAEAMRVLEGNSAQACLNYMQPSRGTADLAMLPTELRERDSAALAAIIETGARATSHAVGAFTKEDLQAVYGGLLEQFGDDAHVLDRLDDPNVEPSVACGVVTALYERAINLPPPRNAQLLRYLLAGS